MKYNYEKLMQVLALFDDEDIKYIKLDKYKEGNNKNNNKVKIKVLGGNNDRSRK